MVWSNVTVRVEVCVTIPAIALYHFFLLGPSIKEARKILPNFDPSPGRLASTSIRKNLYCVVNFLLDCGHLISHFSDYCEKFVKLKVIIYSIYLYILEL